MVLNPDIPKPTDKAKLLIDSINLTSSFFK